VTLKSLLPLSRRRLTFFIAGLPYLLRFERIDNLGAYSIPSETGLLIPSACINNRGFVVVLHLIST
jgi:hypothetical protein